MLIVLWATCLSEHICINAGPTSLQCLSSLCSVCAWSWSAPQTLWTLCCFWRSLSSQAIPLISDKGLDHVSCCPHSCLISSEYNRVTKCLEWRFTTFIDLDFKPLVGFFCFFSPDECINQRDWHQRAFHWVQKKREPLKIARLCCNELL